MVGTDIGRLVVWMVSWQGDGATVVSVNAKPVRRDRCPVDRIRQGSVGSSMLISLSQNGTISIWDSNSIASGVMKSNNVVNYLDSSTGNRQHTGALFTARLKTKPDSFLTMSCLFSVSPADMAFSFPHVMNAIPDIYESQSADNSDFKVDPKNWSKEEVPTTCCFHPSISIFGRQTSFLVGSTRGNIVKYNIDYAIKAMDCEVLYPCRPFVDKEYIHPNNAPKGFVLTSGNMDNLGNKVYREIFHFHR